MLWFTYVLTNKFSLFWIFLARLLLGIIKAIVWDSNNLFLSEKYPEQGGVLNARYLHVFRYFISAFFILWTQFYINPSNESPSRLPDGEFLFKKEIQQNFVSFVWAQGLVFFLSMTVPIILVSVPERLKSNLGPWLKSKFKHTDFQHSLSREEIDILIKTSRASIHFDQDISRSFRESLTEKQKAFNFEKENPNAKDLVYYMLLFTILDNVGGTILSDNFKYVSLMLGFGDSQISFFYFLSTFVAMTSNFACAFLFTKYGLEKTFLITTLVLTFDLFLVFLSTISGEIFLQTISLTRFFQQMSVLINDTLCFCIFDPTVGIQFVKLFTFGYFIATIIAILINSFIITPDNIYWVFFFFLLVNLANFTLSKVAFKKFKFSS